jgi:hypothetical protein
VNTLLRTLTLWLVLLAVPFQGVAAAAMLGCATGHMPAAPPAAMPAGAGQAHHGMHGMPGMHGGEHHATPAADTGAGHHATQHHGTAKCGACSACSIGAAIAPASVLALPVHAPPRLAAFFSNSLLPSVDLALPERPPRFLLA